MNKLKTKLTVLVVISLAIIAIVVSLIVSQTSFSQANATNISVDKGTFSTATLEDNFCEETILVVKTREASLDRAFTKQDFSEVALAKVQCITPGFQNGIRVSGSFRRMFALTLESPCKQNVLDGIQLLQTRHDIRSAEPNFIAEIEQAPYKYNYLQGNDFVPLNADPYWAQNRIGVPAARAITLGCPSVIVAVYDTGIHSPIDNPHTSLEPRLIRNLGLDFLDDNYDQHLDFSGPYGHGTRSAGLISSPNTGVAKYVRMISIRTATFLDNKRYRTHHNPHRTQCLPKPTLSCTLAYYSRHTNCSSDFSPFEFAQFFMPYGFNSFDIIAYFPWSIWEPVYIGDFDEIHLLMTFIHGHRGGTTYLLTDLIKAGESLEVVLKICVSCVCEFLCTCAGDFFWRIYLYINFCATSHMLFVQIIDRNFACCHTVGTSFAVVLL